MTAFPTKQYKQIKKVDEQKEKEKRMLQSVRDSLVNQIRKDVGYLLKPRPFLLPFGVWIFILSRLIKLDNKSLESICLASSSKPKTN